MASWEGGWWMEAADEASNWVSNEALDVGCAPGYHWASGRVSGDRRMGNLPPSQRSIKVPSRIKSVPPGGV
uniref:Uncharacterized protein n=1 Tax=Knipowitschia caucasica TaxID=637954 RepID=A0AAV2J9G7_KNICA